MTSIDMNYSIDTEASSTEYQKKTEKRENIRERLTNILMVLSLFSMLFIMIIAAIAT